MAAVLVDSSRRRRVRLAMLLVIGLVAVAATAAYRHFRYARPVGNGPAGPAVANESFSALWSQQPVLLLGLGDSVTQGLGASPVNPYFQRLAMNPADEFADMQGKCLSQVLPNRTTLNLAISGTTSIECIDYQLPKLAVYPPDTFGIVVITTDDNDVIHNYGRTPPREGAMYGAKLSEIGEWVRKCEQRLEPIVSKVRQTFPGGSQIFIANIYDPTDGFGDIEHAGLPAWPEGPDVFAAWNTVLTGFADRHDDVILIDMHAAFRGHGIHCTHFWLDIYRADDPHYWCWDNLEDPNDRGYDALCRLFLNAIANESPSLLKR